MNDQKNQKDVTLHNIPQNETNIVKVENENNDWVNEKTGEIINIPDPTEAIKLGWGGKRTGAGRKPLIDYKEAYFVRAFNIIGEDSVDNINFLIDMRKGKIEGAGPKEQLMASKILFDKFMPNMVITKDMTEDPNATKDTSIQVTLNDYTE